jgi:hypothetical protein
MFGAVTEKTGIQAKYGTVGEKTLFERRHREGTHTLADGFKTVRARHD